MTSDFIILGAGCSGLSLAVQMIRAGLGERRVTIVDRRREFGRDRTWCFWNAIRHPFEEAVSHSWPVWEVRTENSSVRRSSPGREYQHLPSDAFYRMALDIIRDHPGVQLRLGVDARSVEEHPDRAIVRTAEGPVEGRMVFDSRPPSFVTGGVPADLGGDTGEDIGADTGDDANGGDGHVDFLQHFHGYFVRAAAGTFDTEVAMLMDFDVSQERGIHFMYVLPFSSDHALVETTYFTPAPFEEPVYEEDLRTYLDDWLGEERWEVAERESGVIPMSTRPFPAHLGRRWRRIGLAGGMARPSSGYAFLAIQRFSERLAERLAAARTPEDVRLPGARAARTLILDRVYLSYLARFPERAPATMLQLFERIEPEVVIRFLSETGSVADDLRVMRRMPSSLGVEAYRARRLWLGTRA